MLATVANMSSSMTEKVRLPTSIQTLGDAIRFLREKRALTLRAGDGRWGLCSLPERPRAQSTADGSDWEFAKVLQVDESVLRRFDSRVEPELQDWLEKNPDVVSLLREVRSSGRSPVELRAALKLRKR